MVAYGCQPPAASSAATYERVATACASRAWKPQGSDPGAHRRCHRRGPRTTTPQPETTAAHVLLEGEKVQGDGPVGRVVGLDCPADRQGSRPRARRSSGPGSSSPRRSREDGTATGFTSCEATGAQFVDEQLVASDRVQCPDESTARAAWPPGNGYPPKEKAEAEVTTTGRPSFSLMSTEIVGSSDDTDCRPTTTSSRRSSGRGSTGSVLWSSTAYPKAPHWPMPSPGPSPNPTKSTSLAGKGASTRTPRRPAPGARATGPAKHAKRHTSEQSGTAPDVADVGHVSAEVSLPSTRHQKAVASSRQQAQAARSTCLDRLGEAAPRAFDAEGPGPFQPGSDQRVAQARVAQHALHGGGDEHRRLGGRTIPASSTVSGTAVTP